MVKNILKVAWRNFIRHKTVSIIPITGLALGIAAFVVVSGYTHYERSYDRMLGNGDPIYRVESRFFRNDQMTDDWATSTNGYATAMKAAFPEVTSITRISWHNSERVVRYGTLKYREEHVCFADSNFFQFFRYPLVAGDAATVLKEPNAIVLSASVAKKYFGALDPIGKFLDITTIGDTYHCRVTGVFADLPRNSTMRFGALVSWLTQSPGSRDFWYMHESYTFLRLAPGVSPAQVEAGFPALAEKYKTAPPFHELKWAIQLVPLEDIHLRPHKEYEMETKGNMRAVRFLEVIAYIILFIASINYINLTTARAADRAKEVGVRKVSGAQAIQLIGQFLTESALISVIAIILALVLIGVFRAPLIGFLGDGAGVLYDGSLIERLALVLLGVILLTGVYPAIVLVRVKPVTILKGRYVSSKRGVLFGRVLVLFQFTASLLFLAGVLAVYLQIRYMRSEPKGITTDQTLVLRAPVHTANYASALRSFKGALQGIVGVAGVTATSAIPGKAVGEFAVNRPNGAPKTEERMYEMLKVDFDFMRMFGLELAGGRTWDASRPADSTGLVLNESAMRQLGWSSPEEAIGKKSGWRRWINGRMK